jgi:GH15 family glucan-1,4-alpha-glucosidase
MFSTKPAGVGNRWLANHLRKRCWVRTAVALVGLGAAACSASDEESASSADAVSWEPISTLLGNPPNFAQLGNGSLMSVVSRAAGANATRGMGDGRGAKAGALVELYWPHYSADNLWDSYVGLRTRGQSLRWAHDLGLTGQRVVPDTGEVITELARDGVAITIEDVVRPGSDAHLRHVIVKNTGTGVLEDVDVAFYSYYTLGNFPEGDRIHFDGNAFLQSDPKNHAAVATLADRPPTIGHCGHVMIPWGDQADARMAAEGNNLHACTTAEDAGIGGVNGTMMHRLADIPPGGSADITYAIGMAADEGAALATARDAIRVGFAGAKFEDSARWTAALARAQMPAKMPADVRDVYRRAIITILQHEVDNGAYIAASTLTSPVYRLIWPRDGSKTAIDMLEIGFAPEAKRFFELLEKLQKPDGSFAVNYVPDGSAAFFDFGASGNENDQPGMLPWGVGRVLDATHDVEWARARWPAVKRAADHLVAITGTGLIAPSRDLWELETGSSWTYANASAVAGLEAAARIAQAIGQNGASYTARAAAIRTAMGRQLVTKDGWFGRGIKGSTIDTRLEIANLALASGGFSILPDSDPRIALFGDAVEQRLLTPGGAVRRYEGDKYYGGQPWPVASAWLAMHRLARGDRTRAEQLFGVITAEAHASDSLMLGEQFEESSQTWLSATPLVWSEAAYIRTAHLLYDE